jgi:hypothetical protein
VGCSSGAAGTGRGRAAGAVRRIIAGRERTTVPGVKGASCPVASCSCATRQPRWGPAAWLPAPRSRSQRDCAAGKQRVPRTWPPDSASGWRSPADRQARQERGSNRPDRTRAAPALLPQPSSRDPPHPRPDGDNRDRTAITGVPQADPVPFKWPKDHVHGKRPPRDRRRPGAPPRSASFDTAEVINSANVTPVVPVRDRAASRHLASPPGWRQPGPDR